ncbi:MAG: FAD-dependent oxidoreductase [Acetobacteraceae bacterium]|nr:FAD-dependent oxidoreductase [Acetobacteraceae bacterium]
MRILPPDGTPFEIGFPVVVIGGGAAGMVAALAARENGADVLVIERDALPRGSTSLSAGLIPAPGTQWQHAIGEVDSPAQFAADIMHKAHDTPDPALVQLVTSEIGPALEWLHTAHGLQFSLIADFRYPGHSALRMHGLPTRSGLELVDALCRAAEVAGVELLCKARAVSLIADAEHIHGLVIERPDGSCERIGCHALILACNGYGGNRTLVSRYIPAMGDALYFGHPGNQGDALLWGEALGAASRDLSGHQGHGSVAHPAGILITWATITEGGMQVNMRGNRFSDESTGYSEQGARVLAEPGGMVWSVYDTRIAAIARQFEDYRQAEAVGIVLQENDVPALARRMGVPVAALQASLDEIEACKRGEQPDPFGRDFTGVPPLTPPYCAIRVTGALFHTQGGLEIDQQARVRRQAGGVFANLYATGGAACGVSGAEASGYLSGNGLLTAVALGRVAGRAASYCKDTQR